MTATTSATAAGLGDFIDASPSPFHVCATVAAALDAAGYTRLSETQSWDRTAGQGEPENAATGRHYVVRGGSIIAWNAEVIDTFRSA